MKRRFLLKSMTAAGLAAVGGTAMLAPALRAAAATIPAELRIRPDGASVLLVVDVQNCFVAGGTLPVKDGNAVIPVINRLGHAFNNVVLTQNWHTPGHISFASAHPGKNPFDTSTVSYGTQTLWPDHCVQHTADADLQKDLQIPHAKLVIRKGNHKDMDSYSAFMEADKKTSTGLASYLKAHGIKRVFVTGLATDFGVAYSALDARAAGFEVYVIEDATRAIDLNGSLAAAWRTMKKAGIERIRSEDIVLS
ncbi:nicotinamidase [Paraherbaspirillum soli]|uniref:nicotinamidase n=1 Tax=Paraherbaspirillum soli TaxID=631222 RepID=A0ABW0MDQ0_9BURK